MQKANHLTWREKERARTKRQILSAARRVFAKKGFLRSTLGEIASDAGLGKGTIYSYFQDKADLVHDVFEDTLDEQLRTVESALASSSDPVSKIEAVARAQLEHFARNRYLLRICANESVFQSKDTKRELHVVLRRKYAEYTEMLTDIFAQGVKAGQLKRLDAGKLSHLFIALMHSVCWYWEMYGVKPVPEKEAKLVCEVVLEGIKKRK